MRDTHEESPSTAEQECRVTPGEGDLKESATEINRPGAFVLRDGLCVCKHARRSAA